MLPIFRNRRKTTILFNFYNWTQDLKHCLWIDATTAKNSDNFVTDTWYVDLRNMHEIKANFVQGF